MKKTILLFYGANVIHEKFSREEFDLVLLTTNKYNRKINKNLYCQIFCFEDGVGLEIWKKVIRKIIEDRDVINVWAFDEMFQAEAAQLSICFGFNYHSLKTIEFAFNKKYMRSMLNPDLFKDCKLLKKDEDISNLEFNIKFPAIVKPNAGVGSLCVSKVNTRLELESGISKIKENTDQDILIEPYVSGNEYSVETFSVSGKHYVLAMVKKYKDPNNYIEIGHYSPVDLSPGAIDFINQKIISLLDFIEYKNGPCHIEFIYNENENSIFIVEINSRAAGDFITEIVRLGFGIDVLQLAADLVGGKKIKLEEPIFQRSVFINFLLPNSRGTILSYGINKNNPYTENLVTQLNFKKKNQRIDKILSSNDRLAVYIYHNLSLKDSEDLILNNDIFYSVIYEKKE